MKQHVNILMLHEIKFTNNNSRRMRMEENVLEKITHKQKKNWETYLCNSVFIWLTWTISLASVLTKYFEFDKIEDEKSIKLRNCRKNMIICIKGKNCVMPNAAALANAFFLYFCRFTFFLSYLSSIIYAIAKKHKINIILLVHSFTDASNSKRDDPIEFSKQTLQLTLILNHAFIFIYLIIHFSYFSFVCVLFSVHWMLNMHPYGVVNVSFNR